MSAPPHPESGPNDGAYPGAVDHYTSPSRRDWVKRTWEEPELVRLLETAVAFTSAATDHHSGAAAALDVLAVGCGTGVALELLRATPTISAPHGPTISHLGVDLDVDLLRVAESRSGDARTRLVRADIRDGLPGTPHDLYLSTGVPYSLLTRDELAAVVTEALATAEVPATPSPRVVGSLVEVDLDLLAGLPAQA